MSLKKTYFIFLMRKKTQYSIFYCDDIFKILACAGVIIVYIFFYLPLKHVPNVFVVDFVYS